MIFDTSTIYPLRECNLSFIVCTFVYSQKCNDPIKLANEKQTCLIVLINRKQDRSECLKKMTSGSAFVMDICRFEVKRYK